MFRTRKIIEWPELLQFPLYLLLGLFELLNRFIGLFRTFCKSFVSSLRTSIHKKDNQETKRSHYE